MPLTLTTESFTAATTGLLTSCWSGAGTSRTWVGVSGSRTSGRPRRSMASRRLLYTDRTLSGTASSTACTSADCRTWLETDGNGELASGEATIHATSSTAAAETTAPATESTTFAGSQVTWERRARPAAPATIWPSNAPARTTTSAAKTRVTVEPSIRSATAPDSWAPSTAPPRNPTIDVAETSSPCRKPERANSSARPISTRSTKDTGRSAPDRHRADLTQLHVEAALERIVTRGGDVEVDRLLVARREERDPGIDRRRSRVLREVEVVGRLLGHVHHGQPHLPGGDGEVVGGEDVVVLRLQGDLLDAVGRDRHLADPVRGRGRGTRGRRGVASAAGQQDHGGSDHGGLLAGARREPASGGGQEGP